jgi:hypothetical protein
MTKPLIDLSAQYEAFCVFIEPANGTHTNRAQRDQIDRMKQAWVYALVRQGRHK